MFAPPLFPPGPGSGPLEEPAPAAAWPPAPAGTATPTSWPQAEPPATAPGSPFGIAHPAFAQASPPAPATAPLAPGAFPPSPGLPGAGVSPVGLAVAPRVPTAPLAPGEFSARPPEAPGTRPLVPPPAAGTRPIAPLSTVTFPFQPPFAPATAALAPVTAPLPPWVPPDVPSPLAAVNAGTPSSPHAPAAPAAPAEPDSQGAPAGGQPPARRRGLALPLVLFTGLLLGCLWLLRDVWGPLSTQIPAPAPSAPANPPAPSGEAAPPASPAVPASPIPVPAAAPESAPAPGPGPTGPAASPGPEIRRATLPLVPPPASTGLGDPAAADPADLREVDVAAQASVARGLIQRFLEARTTAERLPLLFEGPRWRDDVERTFPPTLPAPELRQVLTVPVTPIALPSGRPVALFQAHTAANENGALLRLLPDPAKPGGLLLDWPLFVESHQRRLAPFLDEKKPGSSGAYHVLFRRTHGLDLPAALQATHGLYDLQASADTSLRTVAVVEKSSPLGTRLEQLTTWGTVYLARLQLQWTVLQDGALVPVITALEP